MDTCIKNDILDESNELYNICMAIEKVKENIDKEKTNGKISSTDYEICCNICIDAIDANIFLDMYDLANMTNDLKALQYARNTITQLKIICTFTKKLSKLSQKIVEPLIFAINGIINILITELHDLNISSLNTNDDSFNTSTTLNSNIYFIKCI